ncbi:MAG TPA: hypothetical protein VMZ53_04430 [Kofleriaceae bacterium]|nr:hypothetical protein [Kofleriaceae bacterium]
MNKYLAIAIVCAGCADPQPTVRMCNDTGFDINAVAWDTIYSVDSLANGACSDYETPTHTVYAYTRVGFRVQTDEFTIQPIDFVGEDPLGDGAWSYHLTITDYGSRSANVQARRD